MVVISVQMKAWPIKRKELLLTLGSIVEQVRKENGYLRAGVYQSVEDEGELLLIEEWSNQKDADAHLASDIFTVLRGAASLMLESPEIFIDVVNRSTPSEA